MFSGGGGQMPPFAPPPPPPNETLCNSVHSVRLCEWIIIHVLYSAVGEVTNMVGNN